MQCKKSGFDPWVEKTSWRREWLSTPVFLPGESHGQRNLVGYSPWGSQRVRHDWTTNTVFCMGRCKPLGSLNSFRPQLSGVKTCFLIVYILNPLLIVKGGRCGRWLLLGYPQLFVITMRGSDICWIIGIVFPFGSPHLHLEVRNHWWLCHFLPIDMAGQKKQLIGKDPDAGKDWGQEDKGETEDVMVGWHHRLNGHEFEQAQGDIEGQESLLCCSLWGCRVQHDLATEQQQIGIKGLLRGH